MAKKKSRLKRFLKKALPLAALAGGAMMLNRRRRNQANVELDLPKSNLGSFSDARARMTTNDAYRSNMPTGIDKKIVDVPVNLGRMEGQGEMGGLTGQEIRGNYARNARINALNTAEGSPMIDNPYTNRVIKGRLTNRGNTFKTGGVVVKSGDKAKKTKKKVGIQIKGFGKARKR